MAYAHPTKTPEATSLHVIDLDAGQELQDLVEVDTDAGWVRRVVMDADGYPVAENNDIKTEKINGRFRIEISPQDGSARREWKPKRWLDSDVWSEF